MFLPFHRLRLELLDVMAAAEFASVWAVFHKNRKEAERRLKDVDKAIANVNRHLAEIRQTFKEMDARMDTPEAARLGEANDTTRG